MNRTPRNKDQFKRTLDGLPSTGDADIHRAEGTFSTNANRDYGFARHEVNPMKTKAMKFLPVAAAVLGVAAWMQYDAPAANGDEIVASNAPAAVELESLRFQTEVSYTLGSSEDRDLTAGQYDEAVLPIVDMFLSAHY